MIALWQWLHVDWNAFYRIPYWKTSSGDRSTVDVSYADDVFNCLRLDVSHVPCIVTLSKVSCLYTRVCGCERSKNLNIGDAVLYN